MEPPRWTPDPRKGYMTSLPSRTASPENGANGVFTNRDEEKNTDYRKLWLYVTHVNTGWQLSGQKTQARTSASFYPMNLQQVPVTISGVCANQYEYDKLVDFVRNHHRTVQRRSGDRLHRVDFKLLSSKDPINNRPYFPPMSVGGHIESIRAGHERFVQHPTFEIQLKVTHDNLQPQTQGPLSVKDLIKNYEAGLSGAGWHEQTPGETELQTMDDASAPSPGSPDFIGPVPGGSVSTPANPDGGGGDYWDEYIEEGDHIYESLDPNL